MEFIQCDGVTGMVLIEALGVEPKCSYCGGVVTAFNYGVMKDKVLCDNICCLLEFSDSMEK